MRYTVLVLVLFAAVPALAQTVTLSGTVRDAAGQPVPGTAVEVVANNGGSGVYRVLTDSTVTDEQGRYALDFDRIGLHILSVPTDAGRSAEAPFYVDRAGTVEADLVLGSPSSNAASTAPSNPALRLDFADAASRPAHLARVLGYYGLSAGQATAEGLDEALLARELSEALRETPPALAPERAASALERMPAGSPAWVATGDLYLVLRTIDATERPEGYADYLERYARGQPDPLSVVGVVYTALKRSRLEGDDARVGRYLSFVREHAAESYWGSRALVEFAPDRTVRPGEPAPAFSFPALDGEGTITSEGLAGRVYLLDFWATWCSPCVAERDELAALYEDHRDRGFEIVSVSFDFAPDDVDLERWPMPWLHAYLAPGETETEKIMEAFALGALPKLVLVGEDGNVIAGGVELRPEVVGRILPNVLD